VADQSSLIFISGGVRSGKSSFAEKLTAKMLGHLHQHIVGKSKLAHLVEAGIPILMKGEPRV
jgi:adenosyl cobinamide kinase/adenosyl cobinamide phosphate guanylyltransferase